MPHVEHQCPVTKVEDWDAKYPGDGIPLLEENHAFCPNCGQPTRDMELASPEAVQYLEGGKDVNQPGESVQRKYRREHKGEKTQPRRQPARKKAEGEDVDTDAEEIPSSGANE